mgnify:FL=1|tara:strand:- start:5455 stop:5937 length:483 start_codon:yes stop_codon:yes gene_type:complete
MGEQNPYPENRIPLPNNSVAWSPCMIGENLTHGQDCSIASLAHIGRNVSMGNKCRIQGGAYIADETNLGDGVFIGPNATLLNDKYPPSGNSKYWIPVVIEDGAVIGGGATVIAGCIVGSDAVLGAGSVLTKNIPNNEVWAGNPAKFLMSREQYNSKRDNS